MTTNKQSKSQAKTRMSQIKDNVTWVLSLLTIIGSIFSVGRWCALLEFKAELNDINAKHYQEIATIKEEHMREIIKLQSEKTDIQNELTILKAKFGKEVNHE